MLAQKCSFAKTRFIRLPKIALKKILALETPSWTETMNQQIGRTLCITIVFAALIFEEIGARDKSMLIWIISVLTSTFYYLLFQAPDPSFRWFSFQMMSASQPAILQREVSNQWQITESFRNVNLWLSFVQGLCITPEECNDAIGGIGRGSCASGFGVCCQVR